MMTVMAPEEVAPELDMPEVDDLTVEDDSEGWLVEE